MPVITFESNKIEEINYIGFWFGLGGGSNRSIYAHQTITINPGTDFNFGVRTLNQSEIESITIGDSVRDVLINSNGYVPVGGFNRIYEDTVVYVKFFEEEEIKYVTKTVWEYEDIPYETTERETDELYVGESRPFVSGRNGTIEIEYEVTYIDTGETDRNGNPILGDEVERTEISRTITSQPRNEIIEIGTKEKEPEYVTKTEWVYDVLNYETEINETDELYIGESEIIVSGENGIVEIEYEVTYIDTGETDRHGNPILGDEVERTEISRNVTLEPRNEIINQGTKTIPKEVFLRGTYSTTVEYFENFIDVYIDDIQLNIETDTDRHGNKIIISNDFEVSKDFEITLIAKNGMVFDGVIEMQYYNSNYEGDSKTRKANINFNDISNSLNIVPRDFNMILEPRPETDNFPYTKIYNVDKDNLDELSKYNFIVETPSSSEGGITETTVNYGKYITSLFSFPYDIEHDNVETSILLGKVDTEINANVVSEHIKIVDLGSILIKDEISDGIGYKNITIDLYVPNFGNITLEADEVLNEVISMKIMINILSGKGTLNISNSKSHSVIHSQTTQIGTKIPYEISDNVSINIGSDVLETEYQKPYVELKVLRPDNKANLYSLKAIELSDDFDYLKDNEIMLNTTATEREQRLIKDMISKGIFIKK